MRINDVAFRVCIILGGVGIVVDSLGLFNRYYLVTDSNGLRSQLGYCGEGIEGIVGNN